MEFINIKDSVKTSVYIKLFSSEKIASYNHITKSKLSIISITQCKELINFNPKRLSNDPYPKEDRPRGKDDLNSLLYHRKNITKYNYIDPIWIAIKKEKYILLDGAHRIIASYLEKKRKIPAYIIYID